VLCYVPVTTELIHKTPGRIAVSTLADLRWWARVRKAERSSEQLAIDDNSGALRHLGV
jgi:hypothetical protein